MIAAANSLIFSLFVFGCCWTDAACLLTAAGSCPTGQAFGGATCLPENSGNTCRSGLFSFFETVNHITSNSSLCQPDRIQSDARERVFKFDTIAANAEINYTITLGASVPMIMWILNCQQIELDCRNKNTTMVALLQPAKTYWIVVQSVDNCGSFSLKAETTASSPGLAIEVPYIAAFAGGSISASAYVFLVGSKDGVLWVFVAGTLIVVIPLTFILSGSFMSILRGGELSESDSSRLRQLLTIDLPIFCGSVSFIVFFYLTSMFKTLARPYVAFDTNLQRAVNIRGYQLRRSFCIVSWQWDIKSADDYRTSPTLKLCFAKAAQLNFRYVLVDVITLNQKSINPAAVLEYAQMYSTAHVIVAVGSKEAFLRYRSRFWTNVEMLQYMSNLSRVILLEDFGGVAWVDMSTGVNFTHIIEVVQSEAISATFDLDRLQVLIFTVPFALVLMFLPLRTIRKLELDGHDIKIANLTDAIHMVEVCRSLLGSGFRERSKAYKPLGPFSCVYRVVYPGFLVLLWLIFLLLPVPPRGLNKLKKYRYELVGVLFVGYLVGLGAMAGGIAWIVISITRNGTPALAGGIVLACVGPLVILAAKFFTVTVCGLMIRSTLLTKLDGVGNKKSGVMASESNSHGMVLKNEAA